MGFPAVTFYGPPLTLIAYAIVPKIQLPAGGYYVDVFQGSGTAVLNTGFLQAVTVVTMFG